MPDDLLGTLQPPPPANITQFPPLGQLGIGLAGAAAGMQGQVNPILAQQQAQQDARFRQQVQMMQVRQSIERQRQDKLKLNLKLNQSMLDAATDPGTRTTLAKQRSDLFTQTGLSAPPGMVQAWATKVYTLEQEKRFVAAFFDREQDPQAVVDVAQQFGIPQDQAAYYRALSQSDFHLTALGLPNRSKIQKEAADAQKAKATTWLTLNPQFKDTADLAEEFVQRNYHESLFDLTQQNSQDAKILAAASDYTQKRARILRLQEKQAESDIIKQREIDVATAKEKLKSVSPKPLSQRERTLLLKPFDTADLALADLDAMSGALKRLDQFLPKNTSFLAQKYSQFQLWWQKSGDPDVTLLNQLTAPVMIGLIDRGLHDEKGTRAMQMFLEQIKIVKQFPTQEAYQTLIGYYKYLFGRIAAKQLRRIEAQIGKVPDDMVEEAQRTFLELFPKGLPPNPTLPPGVKRGQ